MNQEVTPYQSRKSQGRRAITVWMNPADLVVWEILKTRLEGLSDSEILRMGMYQLFSTLGNRSIK